MRAATKDDNADGGYEYISIHAAHEGCDKDMLLQYDEERNISIHAAHEGCDIKPDMDCSRYVISIHAAHEGCDNSCRFYRRNFQISIHAAHEGCDQRHG